jgi:hypothetical protein
MDEENKIYSILSLILIAISTLLLLKFILNILPWRSSSDTFVIELLGFIWPVIGFSAAFEFLRKERDKWGWGGILFNFIILYSMFYCSLLVIQGVLNFSLNINFFINVVVSVLGWLGCLLYYD